MKIISIAITLIVTIAVILFAASTIDPVSNAVLAQNTSNSSSSLTKLTDGGSITIKLEPSPNPIKSNEQTQLKVSFFKPNTEEIQPHIDYDMIISETNTNKTIFQASNQTGQAGIPLHTAESIVTIPFAFPTKGEYTIKIPVYGILFNPIAPESVTYTTHVE
jgi:heptaprenylglyceryl phosphate synthase